MTFYDLTDEQTESIKPFVNCIIITVTKAETDALYRVLKPAAGQQYLRYFKNESTFFLGMLGPYLIAHLECIRMGAVDLGGSLQTVSNGIRQFAPHAVIMVGIAFGVNQQEQKIGDILVSEAIINYDIKRIGKEVLYRSNIPNSGLTLYNRFKSCERDWTFPVGDGISAVHYGKMLAGESLINNKRYRDKLVHEFPSVIGGEMEGAGLYAAASQGGSEWLIVKGICDFADGNKDLNKKEYQRTAAAAAFDFCHHVFSAPHVFKDLGFLEFEPKNIALLNSRVAVQPFFGDAFKLHPIPHFELRSATIINSGPAEIIIDGIVFSFMTEIATFYIVVKLFEHDNPDRQSYNSDIDGGDKKALLRIEDIYPGDTKKFQWTLPADLITDKTSLMIEIWSPQRLLSAKPGDDRIALFDRKVIFPLELKGV